MFIWRALEQTTQSQDEELGKRQAFGWEGFLNLNKPMGMTSHDCIGAMRRILHERRIGHGGTLDPAAMGVLPLAVGRMTRLLRFLGENKRYRATIRLGVATDTDDLEGTILYQAPAPHLTLDQVRTALTTFEGTIEQIPPRFSAIRRDGKRLYELARSGKAPDLEDITVRQVRIDQIIVLEWQSGNYPEVMVDVVCGAGTYIRSIARDLGSALGCGGTLARLVRTASGLFCIEESCDLETVRTRVEDRTLSLISPRVALAHLPVVCLDALDSEAWHFGQQVFWAGEAHHVQVWDAQDRFLGIGLSSHQKIQPVVVLTQEPG